jgi:hypothetical protein
LVFFYSIALIQFIVDLFNNFILGGEDNEPETVTFVQNDDEDNFSLGMSDD